MSALGELRGWRREIVQAIQDKPTTWADVALWSGRQGLDYASMVRPFLQSIGVAFVDGALSVPTGEDSPLVAQLAEQAESLAEEDKTASDIVYSYLLDHGPAPLATLALLPGIGTRHIQGVMKYLRAAGKARHVNIPGSPRWAAVVPGTEEPSDDPTPPQDEVDPMSEAVLETNTSALAWPPITRPVLDPDMVDEMRQRLDLCDPLIPVALVRQSQLPRLLAQLSAESPALS